MAKSKTPDKSTESLSEDQMPPDLQDDERLPDDPPAEDLLPKDADTIEAAETSGMDDEDSIVADDSSETAPDLADDALEADATGEPEDFADGDDAQQPVTEDEGSDARGVPGTLQGVVGETAAPPQQPAPPVQQPAPSRGGMGVMGFLLAGVVGGAVGYGAAWLQDEQSATMDSPAPAVDMGEIDARIGSQSERLAELEDRFASIEGAEAPTFDTSSLEGAQADLAAAVNGIVERIDSLEQQLSALDTRIDDVASQPAMLSPDGSQAMAEQLAEFRSQLAAVTEEARAEVEAAKARATEFQQQAAAEAAAAGKRAALSDIRAALESGTPYADALTVFDDPPQGLVAPADNGVATLADLQTEFPERARAALAEAQTVPEDGDTGSRLVAFFKRHTNARSLEPREGDDADAVLSRAEAALSDGDLATAVAELDALSGDAAAAMEEWRNAARIRLAAVDGADTLAAAVNEN